MALFGLFGKKKNEQEAREKERIEAEARAKAEAEAKERETKLQNAEIAEKTFLKGIQCLQNEEYEKSFSYVQKAANMNHPKSPGLLSLMYLTGKGVKRDLLQARKWAEKALENGDETAKELLREVEFYTLINDALVAENEEKHYAKALDLYKKAYEMKNQPNIAYEIGRLYCEYIKLGDFENARIWMKKALDGGLEKAKEFLKYIDQKEESKKYQHLAGKAYEAKNIHLAIENYKKAFYVFGTNVITFDQIFCAKRLGEEYDANGDIESAIPWIKIAAEHGVADSQIWLSMYFESLENHKEAKYWAEIVLNNPNGKAVIPVAEAILKSIKEKM